LQPKKLAKLIRHLCDEKKGIDPIVFDVRKISDVTNYYVIVSGSSSPQVQALADNIAKGTKKEKDAPIHVEKDRESRWIVIDHGDVVTHVFHSETRVYYNLERLWGDAPQIEV